MKLIKYSIITFIILIFICLSISIGSYIEYSILSNDFIGFLELSNIIRFDEFSTWYNGIMPIGYIGIVSFFAQLNLNIAQELVFLNIFFGAAFLTFIFRFFKGKLNFLSIVLFLIFIAFIDTNLSYYLMAQVPTYIFTILISSGLFMIFSYHSKDKFSTIITGFVLLLLSTLLRYHGILICVLTFIFLFRFCTIKQLGICIAVAVPFILFFLATNYVGTGSLFSSQHSFGIIDVNWFEITPEYKFEKASLSKYLRFYLTSLTDHFFYLLPLFFIELFGVSNKFVRKELIVFCIVYYFLIKLHPSPRGIIAIIPIFYFAVAILINEISINSIKNRINYLSSILKVFLFLSLFCIILQFVRVTKYRWLKLEKQRIEQLLRIENSIYNQDDKNVNAEQVFSNDFDFYLPNQIPEVHYFNGGWTRFDKNFYDIKPNINFSSTALFEKDLQTKKIKFLIINEDLLQLQLTTDIYSQYIDLLKTEKFQLVEQIESRKIYKYINY